MAVARCTRPSRTGPACGDRCPGALLVEEIESVQRERRRDVVGDAEWTALGAVDTQPIGSGPVERGEGRDMDVVARRWIVDADAVSSVLHGPAILVDYDPVERARRRVGDDSTLRVVRAEAELVQVDGGGGKEGQR
jgi:hypothetical protein